LAQIFPPAFQLAHFTHLHANADYRFAIGVGYAAGDHTASDQVDRDVLARVMVIAFGISHGDDVSRYIRGNFVRAGTESPCSEIAFVIGPRRLNSARELDAGFDDEDRRARYWPPRVIDDAPGDYAVEPRWFRRFSVLSGGGLRDRDSNRHRAKKNRQRHI